MSLKIPVDHLKLVDSPYDGVSKGFFEFSSVDTRSIAKDIVYGHRTSYLISGYRGAGKSSLIKKIEMDAKEQDQNVFFIYLNFAKYESRTILLRKLIRNFYLQLTDKEENRPLFQRLSKVNAIKDSFKKFHELYERTFYEVSKNSNERKSTKTTSVFGYNVNLKDLILICTSVLVLIASVVGFDLKKWESYFFLGGSMIWNLIQFKALERKREKEVLNLEENSKNSFYDDEIAEYYLLEILTAFKDHIKPVFVLDELDKINSDEQIESLINELKPVMLSGLASFIVVAGQNLYFNYYSSHARDDNPLSTLFSKVHHVPLLSISELKLLFNKLIRINLSELKPDEVQLLDNYINYLIFQSKRIPRKFVILIRQNLVWEDNQAYLYVDSMPGKWEMYTKVLNRLASIDNQAIASKGYPGPIRDYFNMQLLIKSHKIFAQENDVFTEQQIQD